MCSLGVRRDSGEGSSALPLASSPSAGGHWEASAAKTGRCVPTFWAALCGTARTPWRHEIAARPRWLDLTRRSRCVWAMDLCVLSAEGVGDFAERLAFRVASKITCASAVRPERHLRP